MNTTSKQRTFRYNQHLEAGPEKVFPLLCPVREKDWLDGWEFEMIHSESGLAEADCVFKTPNRNGEDTYWTVSRYDPSGFRIEFVRFTLPEVIVKIAIQLSKTGEGHTTAAIAYTYTGLTEAQRHYIANQLPEEFEQSMIWWERSMNHYLKTGELLRRRQ